MKTNHKKYVVMTIMTLLGFTLNAYADDMATPEMKTPTYVVSTPSADSTMTGSSNLPMQRFAQAGIANYLPIVTPELTPGTVTPKAMNNAQLLQPLFLIGSDDQSKQWLSQNNAQLLQLHAIGLLVQANTTADIQTMQALGKGLMIIPAPAKALIEQYGLSHYPVLITKEGITQ